MKRNLVELRMNQSNQSKAINYVRFQKKIMFLKIFQEKMFLKISVYFYDNGLQGS